MKAWTYQKPADVRKLGTDNAPWYTGWYEPDGRRKGKAFAPGFRGKKLAETYRDKVQGEIAAGTYQSQKRKPWEEFKEEYIRRVLDGLAVNTRLQSLVSLGHFERIAKPLRVSTVATHHIADFVAKRRQERGRREGDIVSPASVNKDLRQIKAALVMAVEWGYLPKLPKFRMEKVPGKLPTYVSGDHFAAIYKACDVATMPANQGNINPADWWRGLLVMGYMTGWRIGDMLALRRDQLDLDAGTAVSLAGDNKGKRDERVELHPVVVDHLRQLTGFTPTLFPWPHNE